MDSRSRQQRRRDTALSSLNVAIETTNITNGALRMTPANAALGSVTVILTMIRVGFLLVSGRLFANIYVQDSMINEEDYVDLGLACAEVCKVLDRGMNGRRVNELSQPVFEAIGQSTTWVESATHTPGHLLTKISTAGLWPGSRGRSSSGVNDALSLDSSTPRPTEMRLPLGGWNSTESFASSTCVP